jgi:hypothetical protein
MAKKTLLHSYLLISFLLFFSKNLPVSNSPSDLSLSLYFSSPSLSAKNLQFKNPSLLFHSQNPIRCIQKLLLQIALSSPLRSQTAILHNCITGPSHNSEPPLRLHTHSVQPSCRSLNTFLKKQQNFPCRSKEKGSRHSETERLN